MMVHENCQKEKKIHLPEIGGRKLCCLVHILDFLYVFFLVASFSRTGCEQKQVILQGHWISEADGVKFLESGMRKKEHVALFHGMQQDRHSLMGEAHSLMRHFNRRMYCLQQPWELLSNVFSGINQRGLIRKYEQLLFRGTFERLDMELGG